MITLGKTATLNVIKIVPAGLYLDGGNLGEIFLPKREAPINAAIGDPLTVFIYRDSETVLTATTARPKAELGQCARMKVIATNSAGAFMDWGLPKDLFVPKSEQYKPFEIGRSYVVLVYLDHRTERLAGTAKLHSQLSEDGSGFTPGQAVDLIICGVSELGYKAIINHGFLGLIHRDDAPSELQYGQSLGGYIKAIRPDKKIDVSLLPPGVTGLDVLAKKILDHLESHGGKSQLTDKSPAEDIIETYGASKSTYKKALGRLYKSKKISIQPDSITLIDSQK